MNKKEFNINDDILDKKKKILNDKEEDIMRSQIIQNKLKDKIRKMEIKKENIIKDNKWLLGNIIYTVIYDMIMAIILILFVIGFTNNLNLIMSLNKTIYIITFTLGILTFSVAGAYISAKIGEKLKYNYNKKRIVIISKRICEKEIFLTNEIIKQENIKKEITNIMNELDCELEIKTIEPKNDETYHNNKNVINEYNKINKTGVKKRIKK